MPTLATRNRFASQLAPRTIRSRPLLGVARSSATSSLKTQVSLKDFKSRAMLGAILPLHDVRYHAAARCLWSNTTAAELFSTDELKTPRSTREWWSQTGSNRRPPACKAGALPTELWPRRARNPRAVHDTKRENVNARTWWAWEDLNFRPHAYQARALTN
jgi:hypothetical protein